MEKDVIKRLENLGLGEYESQIYFDLLKSSKPKGASKIGVSTKLNRQYVYRGLEKLVELGLVTKVPFGKWSKFKAENENLLLKMQKQKLAETEDLVSELNKYSKYNVEQEFEIIVGAENLRKFELNRYKNLKANSETFIVLADNDGFMKVMGDTFKEATGYIKNKSIKLRMLGNTPDNFQILTELLGPNFKLKKPFNFNTGYVSTLVCDNYVCFYTYVNPPTVYVIYSEKVAESYRNFFMSLWNNL